MRTALIDSSGAGGRGGATWIVAALAAFALAAATAAADTVMRTSVLDAGGGRSTAGDVVLDATLGGIGGLCANGSVTGKMGYAGQLYDAAGLTATASPTNVAEGGTRQLTAAAVNDDDTRGELDGTPQWAVAWGPLASVSGAGLASAGAVYRDTPAGARAVYEAKTGTVSLLVQDVNPDNYGLYASDGVPDGWQVDAFGEENPLGGGSADPDGDRVPNSGEYAGDTDPNDEDSFLGITAIAREGGTGARVWWQGGQQATQYVERSASLTGPAWRPVRTNLPPTAAFTNCLDPSASNAVFYYRIRAVR